MQKLAVIFLGVLAWILTAEAGSTIPKRQKHQESRIQQGLRSRSLTQVESRKLQRSENRIERATAHATKDGVVTFEERRGINQMQNKQSQRIWKAKHN